MRWLDLHPLVSISILLLAVQIRAAGLPGNDAQQLAREVIQNEVQAEANNHNLWSYRELTRRNGNELLYEYRETNDGTIHRLLAVNGHPLNPKEREAEDARIRKIIRSPEAVKEAQKKEDADGQEERKFLKLFPDVFVFHEEAHQGDLMGLTFTPNPKFHPFDNMTQVLHSLQGTMTVDTKQKRLVSINGRLTGKVKFWGGF